MGKDDASGTRKAFTKAAGKTASATASVKDAGVTMILTSESGKMESATVRERWSGSMLSKLTKASGKAEYNMEKEQVWRGLIDDLDFEFSCLAKWHGSRNAEYTGSWKNGQRDGIGAMTYGDGSYYNGEWKEGRKWGKAEVVSTNGYKEAAILFEVKSERFLS